MHDTVVTRSLLAQLIGMIMLMRPKQWVKNGFVLAPLLFAGEFLNPGAASHALLAVALFCLASSTTYIINDIHDIEHVCRAGLGMVSRTEGSDDNRHLHGA